MGRFYPHGPIKGAYGGGPDAAFMIPAAEWLDATEARDYTDDNEAEAGWYARLTAPGYTDCTDWTGPYPSCFRALRAVCRLYDVKLSGQPYDD